MQEQTCVASPSPAQCLVSCYIVSAGEGWGEGSEMDKLTRGARTLRKNHTAAEARLWSLLRDRGLCRYKFRRQYTIHPYIVDFICLWKKIIIELDGGQHAEAQIYDQKRTAFLESKGYRDIKCYVFGIMLFLRKLQMY